MKQKILCVGTLIVDMINETIERCLKPGEGVNTTIGIHPGGNVFNVSVSLARLKYPGADIACLGAAGDDIFGKMFFSELKKNGIIPEIKTVSEKGTSKIFILQVKGEDCRYHLDEGANASLDPGFIVSRLESFLPDIFYIGEIGMLAQIMDKFTTILARAKSLGSLTVVDMVIPPGEDWGFFHKAVPFIDILHCDQYQAQSLTGTADMKEALHRLSGMNIPLPVITLAGKGLLFAYDGINYSVPAFNVMCRDSTGAGDAFTAGIIKQIAGLEGAGLKERINGSEKILLDIIIYGAAAGASAVTEIGCTTSVSEENVLQLMNGQAGNVSAGVEKFR